MYAEDNDIKVTDAQVTQTVSQLDDSVGKKAVDDQLKAHDLTRADLSDLAHRILLFGAVQTEVAADARPIEQYEDDIANYTTVQVDHILVKTKAEADEVYAQVTAPGATEQDFLDLAKEVSIDPSAKQNSGSLGSAVASTYVPEFAAAAIALEPGEISKPVKTQFGWHVIRMVEKDVQSFEDVKAQLLRSSDAATTAFNDWLVDQVVGRRGGHQPEVRSFRREDVAGPAHLEHVDRHRHAVGPRGPVRVSEGLTHVPEGPVPASQGGARLLDLIRVQARLRAPGGCPWDAEQTHQTLARHLLEETHELLEAIDAEDSDAIRDELGDLLLQVTFHAQIAADDGRWDVDDVAQGLVEKLIHRHPHVFGEVEVSGSDEVLVNWERLKAEEPGGQKPIEDDIPATLPALARAAKVQRRAAGWGFEWRSPQSALAALREEVDELASAIEADDAANAEEEIGDVLFSVVAVARKLGVDGESALRRTIRGFGERYERFAGVAAERGLDVDAMSEDEVRTLFREVR